MRRVKVVFEVVMDAYWRLAEDDGWAIASHLAMSTLTSMFPFLIFVTALAGCSPWARSWQSTSRRAGSRPSASG